MTAWRYRAAALDGRLETGVLEAANVAAASAVLVARGLCPVSLTAGTSAPHGVRHAPLRDLATLFRTLATLLEAGLPLERALVAAREMVSDRLRSLLERGVGLLGEGAPLALALADNSRTVPPALLTLLAAGERAGRLTEALSQLAEALEHEVELRARLMQALAYPAVLAATGTASLGVISGIVVPRFATMLQDTGQALPPLTAALVNASAWVARWWPVLPLVSAAAAWLVASWIKSPDGRRTLHRVLLDAPGIGVVRCEIAASRALRALHAALSAGMSLVPALALARDASADQAVRERLERAADRVLEGGALARSMTAERALPSIAIQLIALGESSGQLGVMAGRAASLLQQSAERRMETVVRLVEPGLILFFGGLVGLVAAALLQAVYSLRPGAP